MPTPGRRLIAAFVAGIVASAFLFAFPLWTIRERVMDLQEQEAKREIELREATGATLVDAANATARWSPSTGPEPLERARLDLAAARALVNLTQPANGTLDPALAATDSLIGDLSEATRCQLLDPSSAVPRGTAHLATLLRGVGLAIADGEDVGPAQIEGAVETVREPLRKEALSRSIENATLSIGNDTAHVSVTFDRPLPAPGCRDRLTVEACVLGDASDPLCRSTEAADTPLEVLDERTIRAPSPVPTNETENVRVVVQDIQLGEQLRAGCLMPARDGAGC